MALAIMGGLTVATVLTIFFVPALYAAWFKVRRQTAGHTEAMPGPVVLVS
jgi:Cu/Ag efflux pump CusA